MTLALPDRHALPRRPSRRPASPAASRVLPAAAFALLCLWTGSSPASLARGIAVEGFDLSDARA